MLEPGFEPVHLARQHEYARLDHQERGALVQDLLRQLPQPAQQTRDIAALEHRQRVLL
jgi:hypothetical protein